MPAYEILLDGKPRRVELAKKGENAFTATVDGRSVNVQLQAGLNALEKPFSLNIDGKAYRIDLPGIDREKPFPVKVDGATFEAEVKMSVAKTALTTFAPTQLTPARKATKREHVAEGGVTAPMTGKIMSIRVKKGDLVKANQVLCVVEAMKMENEICAPKAGAVQEVRVAQGSSVNEGDILFVIG